MKAQNTKNCPSCGQDYAGYPAISRVDNTTNICSACGTAQALAALLDALRTPVPYVGQRALVEGYGYGTVTQVSTDERAIQVRYDSGEQTLSWISARVGVTLDIPVEADYTQIV